MSVIPHDIFELFERGEKLSQNNYRGRFAPSPSGTLHLGNIRTAFASWLIARLHRGQWLLRFDDLDLSRNRCDSIQRIQDDLKWLGLNWDGPIIFQSKRISFYESALNVLERKNKLYACRCSRKLIAETNRGSKHFIYPGTCRNLELPLTLSNTKINSIRLKVSKTFIKNCGDIILRRADGFIAYHLATVIDDLLLGINEVIRGEDLAQSMFAQLAVIEALNQRKLSYRHVPILCDSEGKKLSKRNNDNGLDIFRDRGMYSSEVIGWLAWSLGIIPEISSLSALELLTDLIKDKKSINTIFGC